MVSFKLRHLWLGGPVATEMVCTQCRREKSFLAGNPGYPSRNSSVYLLNYCHSLHSINVRVKSSKAIPVTGRGGLQGCEMLRIPHCLDNGQCCQPYAPAAFYSPETLFFCFWYSILLEAKWTPWPSGRIRKAEKRNHLIGSRTRDPLAYSTVVQPLCYKEKIVWQGNELEPAVQDPCHVVGQWVRWQRAKLGREDGKALDVSLGVTCPYITCSRSTETGAVAFFIRFRVQSPA
jgi:hypothetical protein